MSVNYKGDIHDLLLDFFMVKDGFNVGEKLEHLKKQLPEKRYCGSTDEQIYNTLLKVVKDTEYYTDEPNAE